MDPPKPNFDTPISGSEVAGDPWAFDVILVSEGPGNPAQKYYYPQDFINDPQTSALYNGAQGYIDHDGMMDAENRPERSMRDLVCWYDQVRPEGNALKARQHIIPSKDNEFWRDVVKESIRYRGFFPEKNLCGLSIVQRGDWAFGDYNGDQWKFVKRATAVKSVDLVTLPARGGMVLKPSTGAQIQSCREQAKAWMMESMKTAKEEMQKQSGQSATPFAAFTRKTDDKSKESESGTPDLMGSLTGLRDLIEAADDSMPLKKELRRGLDNAITAASKNQEDSNMKEGELVVKHQAPPPAGAPGGDQDEAMRSLHGEAAAHFAKQAETATDPAQKKGYQAMAEAFGKLGAPVASPVAPAAGQESEGEEEAEDEGEEESEEESESKGKGAKASESLRLEKLEINELMRESGLVGPQADLVREALKGKNDKERRSIIKKASSAFARESQSTTFNAPARQMVGNVSLFASKFNEFTKKKGGR
jgi:hypothetical protein